MNQPGTCETRYFAIASNFEPNTPTTAALKTRVKDMVANSVLDRVFINAPNNFTVPTAVVYMARKFRSPLDTQQQVVFRSERAI